MFTHTHARTVGGSGQNFSLISNCQLCSKTKADFGASVATPGRVFAGWKVWQKLVLAPSGKRKMTTPPTYVPFGAHVECVPFGGSCAGVGAMLCGLLPFAEGNSFPQGREMAPRGVIFWCDSHVMMSW